MHKGETIQQTAYLLDIVYQARFAPLLDELRIGSSTEAIHAILGTQHTSSNSRQARTAIGHKNATAKGLGKQP